MSRRIVVSPHLDDAVFGCGRWLAAHPGATVVTVFAGVPGDAGQRTDWDVRSGFERADEAMAMRRREDRAALDLLGASTCWLDFCDGQYGQSTTPAAIAAALRSLLRHAEPEELLLPLGLFHPDHRLVHEAALLALAESPPLVVPIVLGYEDALYRALPGLLQQRLSALHGANIEATSVEPAVDRDPAAKRQAVACYASQLPMFSAATLADLSRPERYWRLDSPAWRHGKSPRTARHPLTP